MNPGERLDLQERIQQFLDALAAVSNQLASFTKQEGAELVLAIINDNRLPEFLRQSIMKTLGEML